VSLLREHLAGRLDVWSADGGTLRPLLTKADDEALPDTCENLWLRASGAEAWQYDVILMDTTPTTWTFKRDARISLPIDSILWTRDNIDYLRPRSSWCTRPTARGTKHLPACVSLYVNGFNAPPWNESWRATDAAQRLGDFMATPRPTAWVSRTPMASFSGFALGHLERSGTEDHFLLKEMCVRSDEQRRGHGTRLLDAFTELTDVRHWYLLTARDSGALAFYTKGGFRPAGRLAVFVPP
jgi:GNAT superfamily N-acetyltransferase